MPPPAAPGMLPPTAPGMLPPAAPGMLPPTAPGMLPPAQPGDLMARYQDLKVKTLAAQPALFSKAPRADFEFRAIIPWTDGAPSLIYQRAAPDGATPAILYVDTAPRAVRPDAMLIAGFLREAIPGRHWQSAFQQERADLPRFRRFGSDRAFEEGWALYAASLGEELGLYRDDEARRSAVSAQLRCAAGLVVDTGLQAKGWTRRQAADYLRAQLALDEADANLMIDRYVAAPADALSCTMGELQFQALRSQAQQAQGTSFDIHEFHSKILKDGAMPLDILEARLRLWMRAR
jgi:uncharacterized protein (DUF885 family)